MNTGRAKKIKKNLRQNLIPEDEGIKAIKKDKKRQFLLRNIPKVSQKLNKKHKSESFDDFNTRRSLANKRRRVREKQRKWRLRKRAK